jgi:hypothetical protein
MATGATWAMLGDYALRPALQAFALSASPTLTEAFPRSWTRPGFHCASLLSLNEATPLHHPPQGGYGGGLSTRCGGGISAVAGDRPRALGPTASAARSASRLRAASQGGVLQPHGCARSGRITPGSDPDLGQARPASALPSWKLAKSLKCSPGGRPADRKSAITRRVTPVCVLAARPQRLLLACALRFHSSLCLMADATRSAWGRKRAWPQTLAWCWHGALARG